MLTVSDIQGCIIIPTYNNEKTLRRVVLEIMSIVPKESIIIVNDGSTDSTNEILNEFENHVLILKNEQNKCKGYSLRKGFKKAIELGGSTLRDYVNLHGDVGGFQFNFNVYGMAGQKCIVCDGIIKKIKQNGRSSFYCSKCQH